MPRFSGILIFSFSPYSNFPPNLFYQYFIRSPKAKNVGTYTGKPKDPKILLYRNTSIKTGHPRDSSPG
jgi:hypothetical protein